MKHTNFLWYLWTYGLYAFYGEGSPADCPVGGTRR